MPTHHSTKPGWLLATVKRFFTTSLAVQSRSVRFCGRSQDARRSIKRTHGEALRSQSVKTEGVCLRLAALIVRSEACYGATVAECWAVGLHGQIHTPVSAKRDAFLAAKARGVTKLGSVPA